MRAFVTASVMLVGALLGLALNPSLVFAASVTEPSGSTVVVTVDGSGKPGPFTVKAKGFEPYQSVFIEQCNGRPPSAEHWTPTIDCDLGSAPAPAVAGTDGTVTFLATDPNHALHPFVGPSPQGLFNCLSPKGASPGNGLPDFRDCQVRISSSNTAGTDDQVFLALTLPAASATATSKAGAAVPGASTAGSKPSSTRSSHSGSASTESASSDSGSGSSSGFPIAAVLLPAAALVIGGALFLTHKRRSGRVAA